MEMKYKPTKPQKVKPAKPAKPAKAAPMGVGAAQTVKIEKPKVVKAPKAPKAPKAEKAKAISFGKPGKVQADKPMKVGKASKLAGIFEKVDPKLILGGAIVVVAVLAVITLTVILPAVEKHGQKIKHISISTTPSKVVYFIDEEYTYEGMRVTVTRNNGETFTVRGGKCTITGFDSSAAAESQAITVTYEGFSAVYNVVIQERPKPAPVLKNISLKLPTKLTYKLGERFDSTGGLIVKEYWDGSSSAVNLTNADVYGYGDIKTTGTHTLTVRYKEGGVVKSATFTVTVTK